MTIAHQNDADQQTEGPLDVHVCAGSHAHTDGGGLVFAISSAHCRSRTDQEHKVFEEGEMAGDSAGACMKMVGACIQPDGGHQLKFREADRVAWAAFHAKKALWNAHGHTQSKVTVLYFTVFASMTWAAGTCQWTVGEARGSHTLQVRTTRRLGRWRPRATDSVRRTSRWAEDA